MGGGGVGRWVVTYKCNIFYYLFIIFDIDLRLIVIHHRPWEGGFFFYRIRGNYSLFGTLSFLWDIFIYVPLSDLYYFLFLENSS